MTSKEFQKRGQLISTLTMTFTSRAWPQGVGSEAVSLPRWQRGGRCGRRPLTSFVVAHTAGRTAKMPAFRGEELRAIRRARTAGGSERDRPAGTSEHIEWVTFWGERASVVVKTGVASCGERASGVRRRGHRRAITMCISMWEKRRP
jgi:hypothetical protein